MCRSPHWQTAQIITPSGNCAPASTNSTTVIGPVSFEIIARFPRSRMLMIQPAANVTATAEVAATKAVDPEQRARHRLVAAKQLLKKRPEAGTRWLRELVEEYPDTQAAKEARS